MYVNSFFYKFSLQEVQKNSTQLIWKDIFLQCVFSEKKDHSVKILTCFLKNLVSKKINIIVVDQNESKIHDIGLRKNFFGKQCSTSRKIWTVFIIISILCTLVVDGIIKRKDRTILVFKQKRCKLYKIQIQI